MSFSEESCEVSNDEINALKERFRATGCAVKDLGETDFEMIGGEMFPLLTHVSVTPYYLELCTFITAVGQGFLPNRRSKIDAFLNKINLAASLVKFTLDAEKPDTEVNGWVILARVRFVTGVVGGDYTPEALKNLVNLWFQDLAELVNSDPPFELHLMFQPPSGEN